jgi:uncharacterized membrane protein YcaP (DUF421 family)
MKFVTMAGFVVVVLILLSLAMVAAGRVEFTELHGFEYIIAMLLLDAAQDAAQRGDEALSGTASLGAVFTALLTLI